MAVFSSLNLVHNSRKLVVTASTKAENDPCGVGTLCSQKKSLRSEPLAPVRSVTMEISLLSLDRPFELS
ncbi:hypothetical protein M514_27332 [Trichuris suis]|uniref:Uncharacterized protein n=1 Tax=Trichuris suis TaxID=68888 RepID=A0A085MTF0_9BILA|nr:hypothetical protein M514_27332 [Trichuris suis]